MSKNRKKKKRALESILELLGIATNKQKVRSFQWFIMHYKRGNAKSVLQSFLQSYYRAIADIIQIKSIYFAKDRDKKEKSYL